MNLIELPLFLPRYAKVSEYLAIESKLVYAAGIRIGRVEYLAGSGRNADCPRGTGREYAFGDGVWYVFMTRERITRARRRRYVDFDLPEKFKIGVEHLNATVA